MQISVPIRTSMSDNSQIQTTYHAPLKTLEKPMVWRFMNFFLRFRHSLVVFSFWSFLELFTDFFSFLCCQDFVDILVIFCCVFQFNFVVFAVLTVSSVLLLLLYNLLFLFLQLFYRRCSSTSLSNSIECFYVPWSWTDHLPRRDKRHRKQS